MNNKEKLYKSLHETHEHIHLVRIFLKRCISKLLHRQDNHDFTKLHEPESIGFAKITEKMKDVEYGSEEYNKTKSDIDSVIQHHYAHNRHHPEHFDNGVDGMDLIDVIEMLCDWKAANTRNKNGSIERSIDICCEKYGISPQLKQILINTTEIL